MRPPGAGGSLVLQGRFTAGRPLPAAAERRANAFRLPHDVLPRPAGRGAPLPDDLRRHMEQALGGDFREVRVHVDPGVAGLGAEAFTVGSQVYFAPGRYQPHGTQGRRLLGHELTHVLQQRAGRVQNPFGQGVAVVRDPYLEAEADRGAQRAAAPGVPPVPSRPTPAPPRAAQPAGRGQHLGLARALPDLLGSPGNRRGKPDAGRDNRGHWPGRDARDPVHPAAGRPHLRADQGRVRPDPAHPADARRYRRAGPAPRHESPPRTPSAASGGLPSIGIARRSGSTASPSP